MKFWKEHWLPPYVVLWRFVWHLPLLITAALFGTVVLIRNGPREARSFWQSL